MQLRPALETPREPDAAAARAPVLVHHAAGDDGGRAGRSSQGLCHAD